MKKFSARTSVLSKEMIEDAKSLIQALGLPIIQAPSEGEAQTAYMVKKGVSYASVSQDYDNLIFGCPVLVRNLSIEGRRKNAGNLGYQKVKPELILLKDVLANLQITNDQLIVLAILAGTDYNPGGIKGIGPKKALKLVKEYGDDYDKIFKEAKWVEHYPDLDWKVVFDTVKHIPVTDDFNLEWKEINDKKLFETLVKTHGFSEERVAKKIEKIKGTKKESSQKGLSSFF